MTTTPVRDAPRYPVRVDATLDQRLSRWLWLVKWLLAIPHYIVLAFLWVAFAVFTVIAFFAILFTGRYPRVLFDFNVGVLRWSWRVAYYAYGALATDRYPPFSLHDVPDYPAHFDVPYPQHLSRGLVLVKWWLLAIPQYILVGIFAGGTWLAWRFGTNLVWSGGGLIGLLVLFAAISLLFRGRYPSSIFDLVLGLNRWVLRVAAYAALMTDVYPPFRLDQGGHEPGAPVGATATLAPLAPAQPAVMAPPTVSSRWTAGRTIAAIVGALAVVASVGLVLTGLAGLAVDHFARDDAGFVTSPARTFSTQTYALRTNVIDLHDLGWSDTYVVHRTLGDVRVEVTAPDQAPLFLGVASVRDVASYLAGSSYATVDQPGGGLVRYTTHLGANPPARPGDQDFWVAQASGPGQQSVVWRATQGQWVIVAMNPTGAKGVTVTADIGATLPILPGIAIALVIAGLVALAIGSLLIALAAQRAKSDVAPGPFPDPA